MNPNENFTLIFVGENEKVGVIKDQEDNEPEEERK